MAENPVCTRYAPMGSRIQEVRCVTPEQAEHERLDSVEATRRTRVKARRAPWRAST